MTYRYIDLHHQNLQATIESIALGERIILQKEGKSIAVIVTIEELELIQEIESLEDQFDLKAAEEAMKESELVPWEEVKLRLGI
jgi:antitoxin (DNA-binding transcriptional repressor) of toxin-antitoxin stability system